MEELQITSLHDAAVLTKEFAETLRNDYLRYNAKADKHEKILNDLYAKSLLAESLSEFMLEIINYSDLINGVESIKQRDSNTKVIVIHLRVRAGKSCCPALLDLSGDTSEYGSSKGNKSSY